MDWYKGILEGVDSVFDKENKNYIFHIENMDTKKFNGEQYYKILSNLYQTKYNNTKFSLILSSDNNALEFLKKYRNTIFGKVPVVFSGVNDYHDSLIAGYDYYTGVSEYISYKKNIELILKIHPNIKNIYFVNDYLKTGRLVAKNMKIAHEQYKNKINIIYNKNLSVAGLKKTIKELDKDTVILWGAYFADKNNEYVSQSRVADDILIKSPVPVYSILEFSITDNIIGGHVVSSYTQGHLMAYLGKRVLDGANIKNLKVLKEGVNKYIFNANALNYNNIDRNLLPYDRQIINDDMTYFDHFKNIINIKYLIVFIFVLLVFLYIYKKTIFNEKGIVKILVYGPIIFLPLVVGTLIYNLVEYNNSIYKDEIKQFKIDSLLTEQKKSFDEIERTADYVQNMQSQIKLTVKENLKSRVDEAYVIANNIYQENKELKSKKSIQKMIIDALSKTKFFEGRGYYFINTNQGRGILLRGVSKLDNPPNLINLQDKNGNFILRRQIEVTKKYGQGYVTHYIKKLKGTKTSEKLAYVRNFEPYDWHIGTGEYIEDFNKLLKNKIYNYITNIRYGKNGYLFAMTSKGVVVAHGDSSNLVGKNMLQKVDANGVFYTKEIIENAVNNNVKFTTFYWYNNTTEEVDTKYAIATYIKEYDLVIGTGVYSDDVKQIITDETIKLNKKNNEQVKQLLIISIIILGIVLLISYLLSSTVKKIFQDYNHKLNELNISLEKRIVKEVSISKEKDNLLYQQSKMASMGEMIGNIAHQWRQPLSVISVGATGLKMQKEYNILTDQFLLDTCDSINQNAQYLSKTIDDFKNFIKNDRDKVEFDLKDNIESFISLVTSSIKSHEINVKLNLKENLIINSYPNELTQCFMNLFNNAKDALNEIDTPRYLFITTSIVDKKVLISFKDNAGGIDEKVMDKIFEPYFTTKHKSQGTGLGLSMTYKIIVEGMNSTISVQNYRFTLDDQTFTGAEFLIKLEV